MTHKEILHLRITGFKKALTNKRMLFKSISEVNPSMFTTREITDLSDSCDGDYKRRNTGTAQVHQPTLKCKHII